MLDGRVALVQPPLVVGDSYHLAEPLGLLLVGSALRELGSPQIELVDLALELAEGTLPTGPTLVAAAVERLTAMEADTYAFSVQCVDLPVALSIARRLRSRQPGVRVVLGGHHASLLGQRLSERFDFIDEVFCGAAEAKLGISSGRWLIPAYDIAPSFSRYASVSRQPTGLVEVARGCPYSCTYCSIPHAFGRRVSYKPVDQIVEELDTLAARGCHEVHLVHDTLTLNKRFVAELTEALEQRDEPLSWTGMTRADLVDPAMLADLARTGCHSLLIGIDSGDPDALRLVNKRARRYPDLVQLALWHLDAGLASKFYFLANIQGDTVQSLENSLHVAAQISVIDPGSCHVQCPRIVPGTALAAATDGPLTLDTDSPYSQWLFRTVGPRGEPWEFVTEHPDLFSTYYATSGPLERTTARALGWMASRLLEILPVTLTALGERNEIVDLFRALGAYSSDHQLDSLSECALVEMVSKYLSSKSDDLLEVVELEHWLHEGKGVLESSVDYVAARTAVANRRPVTPELAGSSRLYRRQ